MLIKTCVLPALILTASEVAHKVVMCTAAQTTGTIDPTCFSAVVGLQVAGGPRTKTCAQNQVLRLLSACIMLIMMVLGLTNFSSCATAGSLKLFWWQVRLTPCWLAPPSSVVLYLLLLHTVYVCISTPVVQPQGFAYYAVPWSTRSYYVEIVVFSWCFLVGLCVLFRLRWPWLALAQAVALAGICTAHMSYEFAMTTANFWDCLCVGSIVLAEVRNAIGSWVGIPLLLLLSLTSNLDPCLWPASIRSE